MKFEAFLIILIILIIPLFVAGLVLLGYWIEDLKFKRYEKKYPHLFELIDKRDKINYEYIKFNNKEIVPLKKQVDYMVSEQKYMSESNLKESKKQIKELKSKIEKLEIQNHERLTEEDLLQEEIEAIIRTDAKLLKSMKKLGWCKE